MDEKELKIFAEAFSTMLEKIYIEPNRTIKTELKRLEKSQIAIRGKVSYTDYVVTVDLVCKRNKQDRSKYDQTHIKFFINKQGKSETKEFDAAKTVRDSFVRIVAYLMQKGEYTLKLEEE